MDIITELPLVEDIIGAHQHHMGDQYLPYKNHVYRVLNFSFLFHPPSPEEQDQLAIAAAFHDLGMWPGDQIDYLDPSIQLAQDYLDQTQRSDWKPTVSEMIEYHHRFRKSPPHFHPLTEILRKGDWVDATKGLRRFSLSKEQVRKVQNAIPNLGFHDNLIRIAVKEFRHRPLNPLPMMKW